MANEHPSIGNQRFQLSMIGVRIECLDRQKQPIDDAVASGFLRSEGDKVFLYTAWHVFTGLDPHHLELGFALPTRRYIRISIQGVDKSQPGLESIGDSQSVDLPLYVDPRAMEAPLQPMWDQCKPHIVHEFLNRAGLHLPAWTEAVRLEIPGGLTVSRMQLVDEHFAVLPPNAALLAPGDKCLVVGYPYGFSSAGLDQPTAVTFTRFVASAPIAGPRKHEILLDGYGAPGMSGGPVFVERTERLYLLGVYTGDVFPDHASHKNEKTTAMGTVSDLRMALWGGWAFMRVPSWAVPP